MKYEQYNIHPFRWTKLCGLNYIRTRFKPNMQTRLLWNKHGIDSSFFLIQFYDWANVYPFFIQDLLVRPDSCDGIDGECKNGLRKNLRVKWNRLVKKKAHHEIYTIPAELRPQLKQIYVYWKTQWAINS